MDEEPKIDIPIPAKKAEPIDIPIPERTPEHTVESNKEESGRENLTPQEILENKDIIEDFFPTEGARATLNIFAANGDLVTSIDNRANEYLKKGENNPEDKALGLDLKREALQIKRHDLEEKIKAAKGKKLEGLTEEIELIKSQQVEIANERKNISDAHPELITNQLLDFALQFGVPMELIVKNGSLLAVREFITASIQNRETANLLIKRVKNNKVMPNELINQVERYINNSLHKKQAEKYGKRAAIAGGSVGLMMLLSAWFAMKMESQRKQ